MAPGLRRRAPGLRREEVAQLSGVGITWYTWLEQGRPINVSDQVLGAIARTLRLTQDERDHLFRLAELSPPDTPEASALPEQTQIILDALAPLPASVISARYDVLAWNPAYAAVFPGMVAPGARRRNSMWCAFTVPACCSPFVNRDEELQRMVAMLRSRYGRHVGEPEWEAFVADLAEASPEFTALWARQEVATQVAMRKVFRHAAVGEICLTGTPLVVPAAPETRLVVYTPDDEESRQRIDWLLVHPDAPATAHQH